MKHYLFLTLFIVFTRVTEAQQDSLDKGAAIKNDSALQKTGVIKFKADPSVYPFMSVYDDKTSITPYRYNYVPDKTQSPLLNISGLLMLGYLDIKQITLTTIDLETTLRKRLALNKIINP